MRPDTLSGAVPTPAAAARERLEPGDLRDVRLALGLTQAGLARRLGVTSTTVARWERGERAIRHPRLVRRMLDAMATVPAALSQTALEVGAAAFVGRDADVERLRQQLLVGAVRLITLVGPGGTGKTRLALELAAGLRAVFRDGVFVVDLTAVLDAHLVITVIAHALAIEQPGPGVLQQVQDALRPRHALLLLDNFEHVLAAAPIVSGLLAVAPEIRILATSREPLRVRAEHVHPVGPLTLPVADDLADVEALARVPSVALFVDRVRAAGGDFVLREENTRAVAELCCRLDGLPLALELAAARIRAFPPAAMLAQVDNQLDLLASGARDAPPRHQTLRASVEWSYKLLAPAEQRLFRRTGVFAGGGSLDALQAVCVPPGERRTVLGDVAALVDKSLLQAVVMDDAQPRFRLLETIRGFAIDQLAQLGELEAVRAHHARWCLALVEQAGVGLAGGEQRGWLDRLEREHANLRAALEWCMGGGDNAAGLQIACGLWRFWDVRGYKAEGQAWLERGLAQPGTMSGALRARALHVAGMLALDRGATESARGLLEQSVALWRDDGNPLGVADALTGLGLLATQRAEYQLGRELHHAALELRRGVGGAREMLDSLIKLLFVSRLEGADELTVRLGEEANALACELGDARNMALIGVMLAGAALRQGQLERATRVAEESVALSESLGDKRGTAAAQTILGGVALRRGRVPDAMQLYASSLELRWQIEDRWGMAFALEGLAAASGATGDGERAARLIGVVDALRHGTAAPLAPADLTAHQVVVDAARALIGKRRYALALADGRALPLADAVAYALASSTADDGHATLTDEPRGVAGGRAVSQREREVAELVALGWTNPQIAERLVISPRTVNTHVHNMLTRLGLQSRAQIAVWAERNAVVDD